ncbi:hypothetical protein BJ912DRAFT_1078116 [Pholiota molesta]|nr:hypothetical protein BJ912DRAFT_1078116 [Pholiota molesta]
MVEEKKGVVGKLKPLIICFGPERARRPKSRAGLTQVVLTEDYVSEERPPWFIFKGMKVLIECRKYDDYQEICLSLGGTSAWSIWLDAAARINRCFETNFNAQANKLHHAGTVFCLDWYKPLQPLVQQSWEWFGAVTENPTRVCGLRERHVGRWMLFPNVIELKANICENSVIQDDH